MEPKISHLLFPSRVLTNFAQHQEGISGGKKQHMYRILVILNKNPTDY